MIKRSRTARKVSSAPMIALAPTMALALVAGSLAAQTPAPAHAPSAAPVSAAPVPADPPFGMSVAPADIPPPGSPRPPGPPRIVRGERAPEGPFVVGKVLENRPLLKNAEQKPAFPGQTRAPYVKTRFAYAATVVAQGLRQAWGMAFLPDGDILVTLKGDGMRIVSKDGKVSDPLGGVPAHISAADAGVLDVQLDPDFASNRRLFFSYVDMRRPGQRVIDGSGLTVASATMAADRRSIENVRTLITTPNYPIPIHYAGRMIVGPDKKLYIGAGERGFPETRIFAQSYNSRWGKILRINLDGSIPADNPFVDVLGAEPAIWTVGNRINQGFSFHPVTGELWGSEFGEQGGDEINIYKAGRNYGWPLVSYGAEYDDTPTSSKRSQWPGTEQPVYYWNPSVAPSGVTFYSGSLMPEWKNNLFVANLAGQHLARLVIRNNRVVGEERLLMDQKQRIRHIAQGPDGALWALTDNVNGRLIRIAPAGK